MLATGDDGAAGAQSLKVGGGWGPLALECGCSLAESPEAPSTHMANGH